MGAWAETGVKDVDGGYPPCAGEECADCRRPFRAGGRAFRLTERRDDEWVCEDCSTERRGGVAPELEQAADEGMGT